MQEKLISHIFKGCFIAIIYIVFNTIIDVAKLHNAQWTDFVTWLIIVGGTATSVYLYSKNNKELHPFGALFTHGFKTTAVATCLIFIYVLLMVYIINPEVITEKVNALVQAKRKQGAIDESKLQENIESAYKIFRLMQLAGTVMLTLVLGVIGSVIGAVISPKKTTQII